jgi:cysteine-rich repeat protein
MIRRRLFGGLSLAIVLVASQACILENDAKKEERLCVPGGYVFCRCADRAEGTKLCKEDGNSFEKCMTSTQGECAGGEIFDERTNRPVSAPGNPDPGNIGKDDPPDAIESCPGKSTAVFADGEVTLEGDTTTAIGDRAGKAGACFAGKDGKDHVYRLVPQGSGVLELAVTGSGALLPLAYIRSTCGDADTQISCAPPNPNHTASLRLNVSKDSEYYLVVDGASATAGKYVATLKLKTQAYCGDGKVDVNEACDDKNKVENDGCSNNCQQVNGNPATGGSCLGHPVDVWPNRTVNGTGSTNTYTNLWDQPAASCGAGGNANNDHIYAVTPHASGDLVVTLAAPSVGQLNDHMLSARDVCESPGSQIVCADALRSGGAETLTVPVSNGVKVFVAVDGGAGLSKGDYTISFKVQPR